MSGMIQLMLLTIMIALHQSHHSNYTSVIFSASSATHFTFNPRRFRVLASMYVSER